MHIGVTQREIRAERGENELHHLGMFKHFPRSPVEPTHTIEEFIFRQIVERIRVGNLRRRTARHKQMHRFDVVAASYLTRKFECDQAADAVPEQRDRPIQTRLDDFSEFGDQTPEFPDRRILQSRLSARQLDGTKLDIR